MVGAQLTRLTKFLVAKANLNLESTRIIAHSIGAHAAGYTGADMEGLIGHITALDPADPYFGGTEFNFNCVKQLFILSFIFNNFYNVK